MVTLSLLHSRLYKTQNSQQQFGKMYLIHCCISLNEVYLKSRCASFIHMIYHVYQMLQYLQDFSQRIISRTHDIQEQVNGLVHESKVSTHSVTYTLINTVIFPEIFTIRNFPENSFMLIYQNTMNNIVNPLNQSEISPFKK